MKYTLLIVLAFVTSSAWSQALFKYDYKDCQPEDMCMYCGDTAARPTVKLTKYLQKKLNRAQFEYNGRGQKMLFQVYIDVSGKLCVISVDDRHENAALRKDLRLELNNMTLWTPATQNGHPINSGMILEFTFYRDYFDIRYISKRTMSDGRVI